MYTIEITFKFYTKFHPCVASLESAKNLAENYATFPGASTIVVKNDKTGNARLQSGDDKDDSFNPTEENN